MIRWLRRDLRTIIIAFVVAALTSAAPVIAETVLNADTVDFKHAVGAGASTEERAGKLVATNNQGRLPNNIIAKALDADRIDGVDGPQLRSLPIDIHGAHVSDAATSTATGVHMPEGFMSTINTSFVYPPDRVAGRRVLLELIVREGTLAACALKFDTHGYLGPTTVGELTEGSWDASSNADPDIYTIQQDGTTHRITLRWSTPDAAQPGMMQTVTLTRLGADGADTCGYLDIYAARVLY